MNCPKSPFGDTKVIESRLVAGSSAIRRRRECLDKEKHRFTTYERIERPNLAVIKKDGDRQMFDRAKLMTGIQRACEKTSVTAEQMEELVAQVEEELHSRGDSEIPAHEIGELVIQKLADLNDVAYVRFASVYRNFTDIENFERELSKLKKRLYKKR
jgi:transcriptional repressor NrdR